MAENTVSLTKANEYIFRKGLYELNQLMSNPKKDASPRIDQPSYPLLHLFYYLALSGKLFLKVPYKSKLVLKPTERIQMYEELKPAEKYFFLLETLWIDADWEKLQAGYFGQSPLYNFSQVLEFLSEQQPEKKIQINRPSVLSQVFWNWEYFLLYFSFFGFWDVTKDEGDVGLSRRHFRAKSITPSALGVAIAPILDEARDLPSWNLPNRRQEGEWKVVPGSPLPEYSVHRFLEEEFGAKKPIAISKVDKGKPGEPFFLPFVPLFAESEMDGFERMLCCGKFTSILSIFPFFPLFMGKNSDCLPCTNELAQF